MLIFGTRPEAIKLCPLILAFQKIKERVKTTVCVTAQHREMLDQILDVFNVRPDYDLCLMKDNQTLFEITSNALLGTGEIIKKENPDIIVVQGDTTTAFAASLAAYYYQKKVAHVEAGLRTFDKYSPFPEEINRKLIGHIADIHFAPTEKSRENLLTERIKAEHIFVTGNTVIDALLWVKGKINHEKRKYKELVNLDFSKKVILVTGHRRENFGVGFINLCSALNEIAQLSPDVEIVYPVHLNPNVKEPVHNLLSGVDNIKLIKPLDYEPFVKLMDECRFIISDSGGIQEEAPSLGRPVLVTRNNTERPEALEVGAVKLVGTNRNTIVSEAKRLLYDNDHYGRMSKVNNPYGDGRASQRIIKSLLKFLS